MSDTLLRTGMTGARNRPWIVATVLLCAAVAIELVFLARVVFRDNETVREEGDRGASHEAIGDDGIRKGGGRPALPSEHMTDDQVSASSGATAEINALVQERLAARREEKREGFIDALFRRLEDESGRQLSSAERDELSAACRAYFAALDDRDPGDPPSDPRKRVAAAIRGRLDVLARILGSEEEAERVLAATLYAQVAP